MVSINDIPKYSVYAATSAGTALASIVVSVLSFKILSRKISYYMPYKTRNKSVYLPYLNTGYEKTFSKISLTALAILIPALCTYLSLKTSSTASQYFYSQNSGKFSKYSQSLLSIMISSIYLTILYNPKGIVDKITAHLS